MEEKESQPETFEVQDRLQEYERAVEGVEEMIVVVDRKYRYVIANEKFLKMRNMTKAQVIGHFAHEVLGQKVFDTIIKEKLDECFQGKVVRYEMKFTYPELGERDIFVSYFPIEGAAGIDRIACIVQDITDHKRLEEALRGMNRKLIEAQEEERTRIARELHDDVSQRLALLAVSLGMLEQNLFASAAELKQHIENASRQVAEIGKDVQTLSHRLHSPKLELLGLESAAASFCKEFSDLNKVKVEFAAENVPRELSPEISLALFRVLQEALQNAAKHSGAIDFRVSLAGGTNEITLEICDTGIGFEPEEAVKGRGIGLTSMRERLNLVNGRLSIVSQRGLGTTVEARVALSPKSALAGGQV